MLFIGCQLFADKTSLETDKTRGLVGSKALNSSFDKTRGLESRALESSFDKTKGEPQLDEKSLPNTCAVLSFHCRFNGVCQFVKKVRIHEYICQSVRIHGKRNPVKNYKS